MTVSSYHQMCFRTFRTVAKRAARERPEFRLALERASIDLLPEAYLAYVWMTTLLSVIAAVAGFFVEYFVFTMVLQIGFFDNFIIFGIEMATLALPLIVYALLLKTPEFKIRTRRSNINAYLPYASNFVAAMSAANATPMNIFRSLALQGKVYGEVTVEAGRIYKDAAVLGLDLITSIKRAVERSPSDKLADLLQGIVSTLQSGGQLKAYFINRAEQYMKENRAEQRDFLETLSFMAESYVVVAVAMPIFLMIILVIMYWVSGSGMSMSETLLWVIIFGMLPAIHIMYIIAIYFMTPEV